MLRFLKYVLLSVIVFGLTFWLAFHSDILKEEIEMRPFMVEELTLTVTKEDIGQLERYPVLKKVDLTGSTCYAAIADYMADHPEVEVTYTVQLGQTVVENDATALRLEPGSFDRNTLMINLQYLPDVKRVDLIRTEMTMEQIETLRGRYPGIEVDYTLDILGNELATDDTAVDLSGITPDQLQESLRKLSMLPAVISVELMDESGTCALSVTEVKAVMDAVPNAAVNYSFELFGKTVTTADERVEYINVPIGNEGEEQIRQALDILQSCTYFKLDSCGIDNDIMASIRDDYPDTKVVWRVWYGKDRDDLTDVEMILATFCLDDSNCYNMRYFTDLKYLDIGHNTPLTDVSFVEFMPNLEIVIVSGASVTDITAFRYCQKLYFLEFAFCGYLKDIEVLAEMPNLKFLNISFTKVEDLTPLEDLNLERLNCLGGTVPVQMQLEYERNHPDCWCRYTGRQPYGYGWRYDDDGYTYSAIYRKVRDVFGYDYL